MKIIVLFIITTISYIGFSQKKDNGLIYNDLDLDNNDDYSSFSMMDTVVENYSVFFIGENHKYRISNSKQQLKMLKYLNKKVGVNHLFMECGFSRGYLINEYIQTGDSTILKGLENFTYNEYSDFYKELYTYNQTLEPVNKITIHGIDLERSFLTGVKLLNQLMPVDVEVPNEISLHIETITSLDGYNTSIWESYKASEDEDVFVGFFGNNRGFNQVKSLNGILDNYAAFTELYKSYYGDNYYLVEKIMIGLLSEEERLKMVQKGMIQAPIFRENFMFNSFMSLVDSLPGEKFFGEFGRCHTSTEQYDEWCNYHHFKSLATRIQNSTNVGVCGKVMSIGAFYPNDEVPSQIFSKYSAIKVCETLRGTDINLVYVTTDSTFFGEQLQSFKFLIVNNNTIYEEFEKDDDNEGDKLWQKQGYKNSYVHVDGLYGFSNFRFNNLNNQLKDMSLPNLSNTNITYGGALTVYSSYNLYNRFSFLMMDAYSEGLGDTSAIKLTSNQFMWHIGGNLSSLEMFSFAPNVGFGYQQLKLKIDNWYDNEQELTGEFFTNSQSVNNDLVYRNGAFLVDLAFDARVNVKFLSLGIFGGYQLDPTAKKWWLNGKLSDESPKTSLTGWHAHVSLSFYFHD